MIGFNIKPGTSAEDLAIRKKMAAQLAQGGMSTEPVGHWTQGLARALQGGLGGLEMAQIERKEGQQRAEGNQLLTEALGGAQGGRGEMIARLLSNPNTAGVGQKLVAEHLSPQKAPNSMREFELAQSNPAYAQFLDRKSPQTNVSVNTVPGFAQAQTEARLKVDTETAKKASEQAMMGQRLMPLLDQVEAIADKTPGGWAGPIAATTARALAGMGMEVPEGMSNAELLSSISQRLIPIVREPGPTSEKEIAMYLRAVPGLMQSAEGRKKVVRMIRALNQRAVEVAKVYRTHIGSPDLYERLAELDKPLFDQKDIGPQSGGASSRKTSTGVIWSFD